MQAFTRIARAIVAVSLFAGSSAGACPCEDEEWKSLDDDVSRAENFRQHLRTTPPLIGSAAASTQGGRLPFVFPQSAEAADEGRRAAQVFGVDISHWDSPDPACKTAFVRSREIDFAALGAQRVRFVYVKATEAVGRRDCRFADYWKELRRLKPANAVLRGSYHFLTATASGVEQARSYVKFREENGGFDDGELPSGLDLEWDKTSTTSDRWTSKTPEEIVGAAAEWLDFVESKSGKRPLVYTSSAWLGERHITPAMVASLHAAVWVADYTIDKPELPGRLPWTLWQFTEGAGLANAPRFRIDASVFNGDLATFETQMGIVAP